MTNLVRVTSVKAELRTDSPDVATPAPRLSWKSVSSTPDWFQASAEVELDGSTLVELLGRDSVLVNWPFPPIEPRSHHVVRVRVTGEDGVRSDWSEPQHISAAFLGAGEWDAKYVRLATPARSAQPFLVRRDFQVDRAIAKATLYASAQGVYQVEINGTEVDDQILKPGWTSYQFRQIHETTDVTALVASGANAIGISVAGGWFTENFGFREGAAPFYGTDPATAARLVLEYVDGSVTIVTTDADWKSFAAGPITSSGIYAGENYDATKEQPGWSSAGFDDSSWIGVAVDGETYPEPSPRSSPAVRAIEELSVHEVIEAPNGDKILDFGQNLVGRLRITVSGERGDVVTLRHAEVLEDGVLGIRPLRLAAATDTYTLAGGQSETWEPRFTFHGFRYATVTSASGLVDVNNVTAVVIHSDMKRTGWFDSSHALVNRLHENVVWGMKGNFLYVPTDCPQRDERLGWTGDIEVFAPTASFLFDSDAFLSSWLVDLALEQKANGGVVPVIVPAVLPGEPSTAAAWGDAATIVPTVLYERFGDFAVLAAQYESMSAWSDVLLGIAGERLLWEDKFQYGDWLDPDASPDFPAAAKTDADIIASAYLFRSVDLTARAAKLLDRVADASRYGELRERIRAAFIAEYVTENGRMMSDAQTGYAVAIAFGLYRNQRERQAMGNRLAELTRASGYRIGTGFVGTPLIADALTDTGGIEAATRLLTQTENPSWLYPVTMGATTIWERWDSMLEDGSINPGEMTSFNHYALGAVADWLHRSVGGLAAASPGYRKIRIAPNFLQGFDHANASHDTPYGLASAGWVRNGDSVVVTAVIPANTSAVVRLPGALESFEVGSGTHEWTVSVESPKSEHNSVSYDTPLSDVIDDADAYRTVWTTIDASDPDAARVFRKHTKWTPGRPLGHALFPLSPRVRESVGVALDSLNASRGITPGA